MAVPHHVFVLVCRGNLEEAFFSFEDAIAKLEDWHNHHSTDPDNCGFDCYVERVYVNYNSIAFCEICQTQCKSGA